MPPNMDEVIARCLDRALPTVKVDGRGPVPQASMVHSMWVKVAAWVWAAAVAWTLPPKVRWGQRAQPPTAGISLTEQ